MVSLWEEVLDAERMLDDGDVGALDMFIQAAGTMIDNHRMAKHMFTRHRVGLSSLTLCNSLPDADSAGSAEDVEGEIQESRSESGVGCLGNAGSSRAISGT